MTLLLLVIASMVNMNICFFERNSTKYRSAFSSCYCCILLLILILFMSTIIIVILLQCKVDSCSGTLVATLIKPFCQIPLSILNMALLQKNIDSRAMQQFLSDFQPHEEHIPSYISVVSFMTPERPL